MRDIDALVALENAVFTTDILSRRSFRHFLTSPKSSLIVAEDSGKLAGYALVLYPARSKLARLYSIAVAPHITSRGIGPLLLAAAESGGGAPAAPRHAARSPRAQHPRHRRATKSRATGCSAGSITIMTTAATRCASRSRSAAAQKPRLTPTAESV